MAKIVRLPAKQIVAALWARLRRLEGRESLRIERLAPGKASLESDSIEDLLRQALLALRYTVATA
jgi:hypothetical protein